MALHSSSINAGGHVDFGDGKQFWLALLFSLLLHIGFYYVLPYLQGNAVQPFKRIVVELSMTEQEQAATEPAVPQPVVEPTPIEPQPVVKEQVKPQKPAEVAPVLATEAPSAPSDYVAPTAPAAVAESTPEPTKSSTTANVTSTPSNVSTEQPNTSEASRQEAWDGYGQALYEMVGRNKNYPQIAIRRNWEGQVKVLAKFIFGKLVDVTLIDSSGHEVLDKEALSMLRKAVNQLPVNGSLARKTFTVTVPVDFKLAEQ